MELNQRIKNWIKRMQDRMKILIKEYRIELKKVGLNKELN